MKRTRRQWLQWLPAFPLAFRRAAASDLLRFDFSAPGMGTTFRISFHADTAATANAAAEACFQRVAQLNTTFSDYDPTSELMRLCSPEARYPMPVGHDLFHLLQRAKDLAGKTGGAYDPTCGHLAQLWRRAKRQGRLPPPDRLKAAVEATDWRRISLDAASRTATLEPGTLLDFGGIAKGYAADQCLSLLKMQRLGRAVVVAGGDVAAGEPPPGERGWPVKLRTFSQPNVQEDLETVALASRAVSTSGDLYQFVELEGRRYSHIIDPKTGLGLTRRIACSVFAPDCTTSDALATAMCVLGPEAGAAVAAKFPGVEVRFAAPKAE
jgi:thiamine biosynthesis lipoprotein